MVVVGVAFLHSLGVELPARLRERVRIVPFQVAINCWLQPIWQGSEVEECVVEVAAEAEDGHQQTWTGHDWAGSKPGAAGKGSRDGGLITYYDTAILQEVPVLLQPLNLKPSTHPGQLTVRVTKKFPEVFSAWLKTVPPHIKVELEGDLASFATPDVAGRVTLDATEAEIDWFDLRVVLHVRRKSNCSSTPEAAMSGSRAKAGGGCSMI